MLVPSPSVMQQQSSKKAVHPLLQTARLTPCWLTAQCCCSGDLSFTAVALELPSHCKRKGRISLGKNHGGRSVVIQIARQQVSLPASLVLSKQQWCSLPLVSPASQGGAILKKRYIYLEPRSSFTLSHSLSLSLFLHTHHPTSQDIISKCVRDPNSTVYISLKSIVNCEFPLQLHQLQQ